MCDLETTGLDPTTDRITAIGIKGKNKDQEVEHVYADPDERKLLEEFWSFMDQQAVPPTLVTYNGVGFDLPFLRLRSLAHNLKPKWLGNLDTIDLMRVLFPYGAQNRSKDDVCRALGIPQANGLTGKDMPGLWAEGKLDQIVEHCLDDIRRQWTLFQRMREAGLA